MFCIFVKTTSPPPPQKKKSNLKRQNFTCLTILLEYLSVFSVNAGKYGPEKTPYLDTFHVVLVVMATCILHNTMLEATVKLHSH